ncbi:hypothetical protein COLO4_36505 [Corchorus olitorius]|uniref:BURP domain-containing protein n=1 Tax=Corchorus olitorius TaxID=93759 RepID=A0A1R3G8I4_9ROSI|nr:hypothetical protein COLO4_36505 [Corchorus olitorius]
MAFHSFLTMILMMMDMTLYMKIQLNDLEMDMLQVTKLRHDNAPNNKGVNDDSQYADDGYDSLYEDSTERPIDGDIPSNKGVNDDSQYADDGYDSLYKDSKESRGHDNAPNNKGVNDDSQYADDGYDSLYEDSTKGARDGDIPSNKGNQDSSGRKDDYDIAAIKETMYFFQEDLRAGRMMNLQRLAQKGDRTPFLPQQIADSIPISTNYKLPEILKNFSIKVESSYGKGVRITAIVTSAWKRFEKPIGYITINREMRNMGENNIVCHKTKYPYAVFLCHSIKKTTVYDVPLAGVDGTKVNAVAVCHKDSSAWSPNHIAFKFLKVKPGTVPICHFLRRDAIAWVRD